MREVINIYVGQSGCTVGLACWELFCLEHDIAPDGQFIFNENAAESEFDDEAAGSFFKETGAGRYVPRCVMVDTEPAVMDGIRTSTYRNLFNQASLMSGKEDCSSNFARGYYSVGREALYTVIDQLRKEAEGCHGLQGFILHHALAGGTGSGLGALIQEQLSELFGKKTKMILSVYPSPQISTTVVEPYNSVCCTHKMNDHADVAFLLDNQALYDICRYKYNMESPRYIDLNRLIAQTISSLTASLRFNGEINSDLTEIQTNLVPFPRMRFPVIAYAPFISWDKGFHEAMDVFDLTTSVFEAGHRLMNIETDTGKYFACCLMYRGDVVPKDVTSAVSRLRCKKNMNFVDWCPTGIKVGINNQPPPHIPGGHQIMARRSLLMLSNTTSIGGVLGRMDHKFDLLMSRKAFLHWFVGEGMEEGDLLEAREDLAAMEKDYLEVLQEDEEEKAGDVEIPTDSGQGKDRTIPIFTTF